MDEYPLISIIVPIYNVEPYLEKCIASIMNQSYKNLEIILVNDGSTDHCLDICLKYQTMDARIRIVSKENGGLVSARKAGVLAAQGEYIGYVDADDWIEETMYQTMYEKGIRCNADLICISLYKAYSDGRKEKSKTGFPDGVYERDEIKKKILPNLIETERFFESLIWPFTVWRHLYKKELLLDHQLEVDNRISMGEDVICCYPCYLQAERLCMINECLYNYRQRDGSMKRFLPKGKNVGYKLLYEQINESIERDGFMQNKLKQQMIFLLFYEMLLASNYLFIEDSDIAFPFHIPKHCDVIVYGAGLFGDIIYQSFMQMSVCNIKLWVDSNYETYEKVAPPEKILEEEYDYVLLAVLRANARESIKEKLMELGIPNHKIADMDQTLLTKDYLEEVLNSI